MTEHVNVDVASLIIDIEKKRANLAVADARISELQQRRDFMAASLWDAESTLAAIHEYAIDPAPPATTDGGP